MLYRVVVAGLKLRGTTLASWSASNGVKSQRARLILLGVSTSAEAANILDGVLSAADRRFVERAYFEQVEGHFKALSKATS